MVKTTTVSHEQIHCRMFSRCFVFANVQEFHIRQRMLPTTPVNNFPWHTNPQSGPRVLSHSSNANMFATSACLLPSQHTHTTHRPTPPIPPTTQNTHSETDTNPQRQPKHKPTDGRMDTDRHHIFRHTHNAQTHNKHNTTTRQHDNVLTDKETKRQRQRQRQTETDRQTDRPAKIRQTEHNRTERNVCASVCV